MHYTSIYDYCNKDGKLLYQICRTSDKNFLARRPDGNGGFIKDIKGVHRTLYHLPEVLAAIMLETIFVVEGEKDANNLSALGLPATTNVFGAGKWRDEYTDTLKSAVEIVLLPDNDEAGREHMKEVAASLMNAGIPVKLVNLPGLADKQDVSDWIENGGTKEQLLEIVENTTFITEEVIVDEETDQKKVKDITNDYRVDEGGIYYCQIDKENIKWVWMCSPLKVEWATRGATGEDWGRVVRFMDTEGKEHSLTLPMEGFKGSGEEARGELLRCGLRIAQDTRARNKLSEYIQNAPTKGYAKCVPTSGWHGDSFVMPDGTVIGVQVDDLREPIFLQTTTHIEHGVATKGTTQGWINNVGKRCRGNSRLIGAVNCALAAPLLDVLDQEPGGINLKDGSSIGKTTAARVAASTYGSSKYIKSWRTTANAIEGTAAAYNDLPLILDEAAQADPKEINAVCYMLGNGKQKSRANKFGAGRPTRDFRNFAISTSEKPLSAYAAAVGVKSGAGAEVRIVEVSADTGQHGVFENLHGYTDGAAFADSLKTECSKNYGLVGVEYLKYLCQEKAKLPQRFREYCDEFLKENLPPQAAPQVKRVCTKFALMAFAGELATAWDLTGWNEGEATEAEAVLFKCWLGSRGGGGQKERQEVIDCVRLFFEQNGNSRFEPWEDRGKTIYARAGFYKRDSNCYYVLPNVLKQEILKGHDFARAKDYLQDEGLLESTAAEPVRPTGLEPIRCYCFKNVLAGQGESNERP